MNTAEVAPSTSITISDAPNDTRGKAQAPTVPSAPAAPAAAPRAPIFAFFRKTKGERGWKRGIALFDFILRLGAIGATLAATITMANTDETLPFFTEHYQFHADYSDLPSLSYASNSLENLRSIHNLFGL